MRFTRTNLASIRFPAGKTEHIVYDDDVPGFGLRLHPGGRQTWFVQYRMGAKQRRLALGTAATLDPDTARRRARDALAKVQLGVDPQAERHELVAKAALTFGAAVPRYLAYAAPRQRPKHHADVTTYLNRHWSTLSGLGLASIKRAHVAARLLEIASGNGKFAANRARAALSAFFAWAIGEGLAEANPVIGTHKATEEVKRDRVLSDDELALVWHHAGDGSFGAILRLLVLTGARREEIGGLSWSEVGADAIKLTADRCKNGVAHTIPLAPAAKAIVVGLPRREGRDLVFGDRDGPYSGWSKAKSRLDTRLLAALQEQHGDRAQLAPWRLHDLRRTAATGMAELGVQPHIVEACLNHVSGHKAGIAGVYNRARYENEKRQALDIWGHHVVSLQGAKP